jgi:hypothetical protein
MSDINTSKVDGNTVSALEFNQLAEIDNLISTSGQTPSTSNLEQQAIASARYSSAGNFFTDSGTANAYVLSPVSPFKSPVSSVATETYFNGMVIRFRAGNACSGASTVNVNNAGSKSLVKSDGSTALTTGDIPANTEVEFVYNGTNFVQSIGKVPATTTTQGVAFLSNPITIAFNGTTQMDIGAGVVNYDNGIGQLLCQTITKTLQSSGSWTAGTSQNGLDTGARANSTWYNIFEIVKNSDNTSDILYSLSRTSPTVPSGYTLVAWIGAIRTDGSGNINSSYLAQRTIFGQIVRFQTGLLASGTGLIPEDNTIPQNTEGDEYMSLQIAPLKTTSKLEINTIAYISNSVANPRIGALFQDSTVNALVSGSHYDNTNSAMTPITLNHFMNSGTTSATTFKFRAGGGVASTTYFNGLSGGQLFGGTFGSSITIKEYL